MEIFTAYAAWPAVLVFLVTLYAWYIVTVFPVWKATTSTEALAESPKFWWLLHRLSLFNGIDYYGVTAFVVTSLLAYFIPSPLWLKLLVIVEMILCLIMAKLLLVASKDIRTQLDVIYLMAEENYSVPEIQEALLMKEGELIEG